MAFKIPMKYLSEEHKKCILKDCTLIEKINRKMNFYNKPKQIEFYDIAINQNGEQEISLPMYYASELFNCNQINRGRSFLQIQPFTMTPGFELRDYQKMSLELALTNYTKYSTCFFNVYCSYGKTTVAAYSAAGFSQQYGLRTLVTFHRILIGNSWYGTFKDNTTAKIYVVGVTQGPITPDYQVILCMDTRIGNIPTDVLSSIGHLVVDEADCFCTEKRGQALLNIQPLFITLLTATYEKANGFHSMLDLMGGPVRITRTAPKQFFVLHIPTPFKADPPKKGAYGNYNELVDELDDNEWRNSFLLQIIMDNIEEKIMCIFIHVPTAVRFYFWCLQYFEQMGKKVRLLAGDIQTYEDGDIIISTKSKVGIGFDEKHSCTNWNGRRINLLLLANSMRTIEQTAGRAFRADVPVIIILGDNNDNVKSQWNSNKTLFRNQNGVVLELNILQRFCWNLMKDEILEKYKEEGELRARQLYENEIKKDNLGVIPRILVSSRRPKTEDDGSNTPVMSKTNDEILVELMANYDKF